MKQKSITILETYEQLKVISDPLRTKMLIYLVEKPYTGHQLAKLLNHSRAKILYHLRELEKHGIIQLVKKQEQGGNILKYYQAVSRSFIPADHLLSYTESKEATKQSYLGVLNRAKTRLLSLPESTFDLKSTNVEDWPSISLQAEFSVSEKKFIEFLHKYREILAELLEDNEIDMQDKKNFYLMITGFQIEELLFKNR